MEKCLNAGCTKVAQGNPYKSFFSCSVFPDAEAKWRITRCPMAPFVAKANGDKIRVGQQKQKKSK